MKLSNLVKHLQGLFHNPALEWDEIEKSYYSSSLQIIRDYYLFFVLAIPVAFIIRLLITLKSYKTLVYQGVIVPVIVIGAYVVVLYLLSIVLEEAADFMKGKVTPMAGSKIAFFSGLPFIALCVLIPIPWLGMLAFAAGFIYQIVMIYMGGVKLLHIPSGRRPLFIITVFLTFIILLVLFAILAALFSLFYNFI